MKKIALIFACIFICSQAQSQQLPLYSFFDDNISAINPALPRTEFLFEQYSLFFNTTYRDQWRGFENAPRTYLAQVSTWLNDWDNFQKIGRKNKYAENKLHVGGDIIRDETSPFYYTGIYGRLGYHFYLKGKDRKDVKMLVSGGLNVGINSYQIKTTELSQELQVDEYIVGLTTGNVIRPDVGFGLAFQHYFTREGYRGRSNQGYYVGISVPQTMQFNLNFATDAGRLQVDRIRHYNLIAGGQFGAYPREFKIKPTFHMRYVNGAPIHYSGNLEILLQRVIMFGIGANSNFALSPRIGFQIPFDGWGNHDSSLLRVGFTPTFTMFNKYPNPGVTYEFSVTYMMDYDDTM